MAPFARPLLLLATLAAATSGMARDAEVVRQFDGTWDTVLTCPDADGALGFVFHFASTVKDGLLRGGKGRKDQPGWFQLEGPIRADGSAILLADGLVGAAPFAVGQRPAGTAYAFHVTSRFGDRAGTGTRVEGRPCTVTFTRE